MATRPPLDKAGRLLYRTLIKAAKTFDERPAIKSLITRGHGTQLPEPLDTAVAAFLGGPNRCFFWPAPLHRQSVQDAVQLAFRFPAMATPSIDGAFQGLRYLTGLLSIARKHGMLEGPLPPSRSAQVSSPSIHILHQPERGAILVAHPCMPSWFSRTVVLVCDHGPAGSYGLCLNKPWGGDVLGLIAQGRKAGATGLGLDFLTRGAMPGSALSAALEESANNDEKKKEMLDLTSTDAVESSFSSSSELSSVALDGLESEEDEVLRFGSDLSDHGSDSEEEDLEERFDQQQRLYEAINLLPPDTENGTTDATNMEFIITADDEVAVNFLAAAANAMGDDWDGEFPEAVVAELSQQALDAADSLEGPQKEALLAVLNALKHNSQDVKIDISTMDLNDDGTPIFPLPLPKKEGEEGVVDMIDNEKPPSYSASPGYASSSSRGAVGSLTTTAAAASSSQPPEVIDSSTGTISGSGGVGSPAGVGGDGAKLAPKQLMAMSPKSQVYLGGPVPGINVLHVVPELGGKKVIGQHIEHEELVVGTESAQQALHAAEVVMVGTDAAMPQAASVLGGDTPLASPDKLRFFLGSSEWVPEQLNEEIQRGSWALFKFDPEALHLFKDLAQPPSQQSSDSSSKFDPKETQSEAWQRALALISPAHAALAAVPATAWEDLQQFEI